ncbi:MAG TPA: TIM barrel protein, partial [Gemmata sp.]|nr:TIM barrel protein [Gemmata sp.]
MKLGLINSAWVQAGRGTAWGIRQTKAIGFDSIDIFADPLDIDAKERKLIRTECEAANLPVMSIACVAVGLVDFNPSVQRFHVDRCKAYLDFAYELGAKNVLLVLGEYIWEKQVIPPAEQWGIGVNHLKTLGEYGANLGVQIALELEPFKLSLLNNVANMAKFIDDVS